MRLERTQGKTRDWIEVVLARRTVTLRSGKTGQRSTDEKMSYPTAKAAQAAFDKLVGDGLAAGFVDPDARGAPQPATPRDATLEAAIRANREDPGAYQVYADWLQERGSPLGELIVLQQRNKRVAANKRIAALGLPGSNLMTVGWRSGFWQWLRIENATDWTDNTFDAVGFAEQVFAHPACAVLEELRIGVLRWDHNFEDVPAVLDVARKHAWARDLPSLALGDVDGIDMAHHTIGDVGKRISKTFPNLVRLHLHSGQWTYKKTETFGLSGLDLPQLRELVIETCSMSKKRLGHVLDARLPAVERLELWFGSQSYGADCTLPPLLRLLDGPAFPKVRHLGLRNSETADVLAEAVGGSVIAKRLESLDLSMGCMTDEGARALAKAAKRFPKLTALSIDDNFLTPAGVRAVKQAFPFAVSKRQKEPDVSIPGEVHYYVSVSE